MKFEKKQNLLKRILKFETILERIKSYLDFEYICSIGILSGNVLDFIDKLDNIKTRIEKDQLSSREITLIKVVLSEVQLYIFNKFSDYV